jgi:hypothetical protein
VDQLQLLERLDRLITEAAPSDRPGLVLAPRCPRRYSAAPTSPRSPAARSVSSLGVELALGRGAWTRDEVTDRLRLAGGRSGARGRREQRSGAGDGPVKTDDLFRAVAEADELPGLVGVLAQAQAVAVARLTTQTQPSPQTETPDGNISVEEAAGDELADLPKPTNLWGLAGGR